MQYNAAGQCTIKRNNNIVFQRSNGYKGIDTVGCNVESGDTVEVTIMTNSWCKGYTTDYISTQ